MLRLKTETGYCRDQPELESQALNVVYLTKPNIRVDTAQAGMVCVRQVGLGWITYITNLTFQPMDYIRRLILTAAIFGLSRNLHI